MWLRSTWEARVAAWLDEKQLTWAYEPQRYRLDDKTYAPDFWIEEYACYWEIKGWFHERHHKTVAAFREAHPEIALVVMNKRALQLLFGRSFR